MTKDLNRREFAKRAGAAVLSVGGAGGLLAACGSDDASSPSGGGGEGGGDAKKVTFGFSHPYSEVPLVAVAKKLVVADAAKLGWKTSLDETQGGKVQDQTQTLETWITQKLTAMSVFPTDASAFEAIAARAAKAGSTFTSFAVKMENAAGGVLFPPELGGSVMGKAAVSWIKENNPSAEVLILNAPADVATLARTEVPEKLIREGTGAKIVAIQPGGDQAKALETTESVLQSHPNVSVVIANNDAQALAAGEAFRKAKKDASKVFIVGLDGSVEALEAIKDPNSFLKATGALDIKAMSQSIVDVTNRAIERKWKKGDDQEYVEFAPTLLTSADSAKIDQFLATLKQ